MILSDSHGYIDDIIGSHASSADEIWHAGDIGNIECLARYEQYGKVRAVYGNIDDQKIRAACPLIQDFKIEGLRIIMTHIGAQGKKLTPDCVSVVESRNPDILVYGHTHIPKVWRPVKGNKLLAINPGAVGRHGFHLKRTMIKMSVDSGSIKELELIELGPRSERIRSDQD